jgi:NitT/TauT family transport system substrate-binding protein
MPVRRLAARLAVLSGLLLVAVACGGRTSAPAGPAAPAAPSAAPPSAAPAGSAPAGSAPTQSPAAPTAYRPTALVPPVSLRVGVIGGTSDAGIYVAYEKGYFRDEGLDVEIIPFTNSSDTVGAVLAGQIDIVTGATAAGIYNAAGRGLALRIVADKGSTPGPEWDFAVLMVRKDLVDSGRVKDYADLKGLTIARASARGTSPEISTVRALEKGGLTLDDVENAAVAFPDMIPAFANGAIDAAIVIEPFVSEIERLGVGVRWRGNSEFYGNQQIGIIIYGPTVLSQPPDVGRRWVIAYIRGVRDYNDAFGPRRQGRDAIIQALARHTAVKDPAVYDLLRPPGLDPDGKLALDSMRDDVAYYQQTGLVREQVDLSQLIDTSYQEYAVQQLGPYQR